eukprot:2771821-Rhodomonas_salina.2
MRLPAIHAAATQAVVVRDTSLPDPVIDTAVALSLHQSRAFASGSSVILVRARVPITLCAAFFLSV